MMLKVRKGLSLGGIRNSTALRPLGLVVLGAVVFSFCAPAHANPQGGQVAAGQASITSSGNTLNINQSTDKAVIDWRSFNIAAEELTAFHQPSSSSLTLNRINDANPSQILGTLTANGHVILVNPNGVFFGPNAKADVSGLVAATANIANNDFMAGKLDFNQPGNPTAAIVNQGTITARNAGLVGLVAPHVENDGIIEARLGKVELASGDSFTLDLAGDKLIEVAVTSAVAQQLAGNTGTIAADGGTVMLTAAAGRQLVDGIVSNSGVIEANSIAGQNGHIVLYAEGSNAVVGNDAALKGQKSGNSTVLVSGSIDASGYGAGQTGGIVQVLGDQVGLLSGAKIDASGDAGGGTVQIGGDFHGAGTTPTAWATVMQTGATIKADAITSGNGGSIALWSDNYTNFAGNIEARGGSRSGNGGYVETSGKQILDMSGLVDAAAPQGHAGNWLMDPEDVTISTAADRDISGTPSFAPGGNQATATLNATDIVTALNNDTNVTITTGGDAQSGPSGGSITVSNAIAATTGTGGFTGSLTLSSYKNITVNAPITLGSGAVGGGNLILDADNHANGSGFINIASAIATNGGNITLGGGQANPATIVAGTGYAVGNAGLASGINISSTVDAGGGNILANGKGYNSSGNNNHGIRVQGASGALKTSGSGTIALSGIGSGNTNSGSDNGIIVQSGAQVSTVNGNITIGYGTQGGGAGSGGNNAAVFVTGTNSTITTANGTLSITATGGNAGGTNGSNSGIVVQSANGIYAGGSGNIILNGSGGNSSGSNVGVYVDSGHSITANGGNITVTGVGAGSGNNEYGIYANGGNITTSGSGVISLNGSAGSGGNGGSDFGVYIQGIVSSVDGDVRVIGSGGGGGSGGNNYGVGIANAGNAVKATGNGSVSITGSGGNGGGTGANDYGIYINGGTVSAGGTGTISGAGAGSTGSGGNDYGVYLNNGTISGSGSALSISGVGGNSSGSNNSGITAGGTTAISNTGSGAITLNGTGQGNTNSGSDYGINLNAGTLSAAGGDITLIGSGGGGGSGNSNRGLNIGGTVKTTSGGNIILTGSGGNSGGVAVGVIVAGGSLLAQSGGNITVTGQGGDAGGSGSQNYGAASNGGTITASGGNVTVTGVAGNSSGSNNYGISFQGNSAISATGSGTVTLNGSGASGTDSGVILWSGSTASTTNGNLTINASGGSGSGGSNYGFYVTDAGSAVKTSGSGNISISARASNGNYGVDIASANGLQTSGSGSVTAVAAASDFFLDSAGSILSNASGTAITLAAGGGDFRNAAGAAALAAPNGRWLIYATTPAADVLGGLNGNFIRFSCNYGSSCPRLPVTGNGLLYSSMLPDTVSKGLDAPVIGLQGFPTQLHPASIMDLTDLIRIDARIAADEASPFLPSVDRSSRIGRDGF